MIDDTGADDRPTEHRTVRKRAMDLLARREHAPRELAAKLHRRGYASDDISAVLEELADDNLLSARRYARAVVHAKSARGIGPVRIRAALAAVEIDEAEIDRALADAEVDWHRLAAAARVKRFGPEAPADFPTKAKQMRFLQQRGFQSDEIAAAVDDRGD